MLGILLILLILFLIGLPFYWFYKLIFKKKKTEISKEQEIPKIQPEFEASNLITNRKFIFMEDYRMWKNLTESEKKNV